jgi:hypothetical protein
MWRYQPVIYEDVRGDYVQIHECYFDDNRKLTRWSADPVTAGGETVDELTKDLCRMLVDAYSWEPVRHSDLRVGMTFTAKITMEQRDALAKLTTAIAHNSGEARKAHR